MYSTTAKITFIVVACAVPGTLQAQFNFAVDSRQVQVHSFASQGFMYSNDNNYMSMPTSKGSFAFTDGGANISTQITDKFRVGAQLYIRNVGEFGQWHPQLDWALGSYKFTSWFGLRAGRVKTALGLYNDTQDMDSLHAFALLPQAIYPVDWRSATISHDGGDVFGDISIKRLGTLSYTGYAGMRPQDPTQGYLLASKGVTTGTIHYTYLGGLQVGGDLRWTTPFGPVFGASYRTQDLSGKGTILLNGITGPYHQDTTTDELAQYYGQYEIKGFQIDVEYRRNIRDSNLYRTATRAKSIVDTRAWYVAGTYRVTKHLKLGAYRSEFLVDDRKDTTPPAQHEFDTAISGRVDLIHNWYMKVEGHFIDGAPTSPAAARGFYVIDNPTGFKPTTSLLVLRTGISF
jgi:hypothetical protein